MIAEATRREVVLGSAAMALTSGHALADAAAPSSSDGKAPATAAGVVSATASDGGPGEPLPRVLVSNGRDIVRTDAAGRYRLPVAPGQSVFVVKPSGYRVPLDPQTCLPKIAYVYDPEGTPAALDFRYRGLPPTGPLPPSIDFHLGRAEEPAKFDVVLFTDPQPESTAEMEYIRDDVVAGLIGTDAAFGITCGDLMFDDLSMYERYNRIVGKIGLPWWNVGGNHDLDYEAPDATRSRDTFKRVFGATYYAHSFGKALFVMLDNVDYLGAGSGKPGEHGSFRGFVSADQLTFVENLLRETPEDTLVVFAMHIPLRTYLDPEDPARNTLNASALLKLIGNRPSVSFAGHTHSTEHHYFGTADGFSGAIPHHHHVLTAVSGAWWSGPLDHRGIACADSYDGTPNGFHMLTIDGTAYSTRFVPAAEPGGKQMRISLETQARQDDRQVQREVSMSELLRSPITASQASGTRVVVNVFDGGPLSKVAYTLDGRPATEMKKAERPDPFIKQLYGRYPETIKKWVTPQVCSHLWASPLPADLQFGTYTMTVVATDEYGRTHTDHMVLEIL